MANVKITDAEALDVLAALEGKAWLKAQKSTPAAPCSFHHVKTLHSRLVADAKVEEFELAPDEPIACYVEDPDSTIHGAGKARYEVLCDGTLLLLGAGPQKQALAESLGVLVR